MVGRAGRLTVGVVVAAGAGLVGTVAATPTAATAATTVKTLADALSASAHPVVGHSVAFHLSASLPSGDKLVSFSLSFGDKSATVQGKKLPKSENHVFRRSGSYTATLTVADRHHTAKHTVKVVVAAVPAPAGGGATAVVVPTVTPAPVPAPSAPTSSAPVSSAPTSPAPTSSPVPSVPPIYGTVTSEGVPVPGIPVTVVDDVTKAALAVIVTDTQGMWAAPESLPAASTASGYDVLINVDGDAAQTGVDRADPKLNTSEDDGLAGQGDEVNFILPTEVLTFGNLASGGSTPADTFVEGCAIGPPWPCSLSAKVPVRADGSFTLGLGEGFTWRLTAIAPAEHETSAPEDVRIDLPGPWGAPTLTLAPDH